MVRIFECVSRPARHGYAGRHVTDLQVLGHGFWMPYVTDVGCGSCGFWSHGFARAVVVLGAEIKGLCRRVAAVFGDSDGEGFGCWMERV